MKIIIIRLTLKIVKNKKHKAKEQKQIKMKLKNQQNTNYQSQSNHRGDEHSHSHSQRNRQALVLASRNKSKKKQNSDNKRQERVYEEMLNNYYMTKYSKLMSKLTNNKEEFTINYQTDLNNQENSQRKLSNQKTSNKKRKNFKDLIRNKRYYQNENQTEIEVKNSNNKSLRKQVKNHSPHRSQIEIAQSRKSSKGPSPRKNFKQSMKQKSAQEAEYKQNLELYKKLQSSIIKELYSPSPKKIQSGKYHSIQVRNIAATTSNQKSQSESLFPQNSNRIVKSKSSEFPYENIEIVQYKYEQEDYEQGDLRNDQAFEQSDEIQLDHKNPFRQTIKSLTLRKQLMQRYSPMKGSRKNQSSDSSQKIAIQERVPWNPHFLHQTTFNKSLSNISSDGSRSSPRKKQEPNSNIKINKISSSQVVNRNQKNQISQNQKVQEIRQAQNQNSYQYFYEKPEYQIHTNRQGLPSINDGDVYDDDGDIEFILPINDNINEGQSIYDNQDQVLYNLGDNLTQRERLIMQATETQQNNQSSNQSQNTQNLSQNINTSNNSKALKSQRNKSQKNSLNNSSIHQLSMISRFSMTEDEGALIKQKLDYEIINNQFGPYQNALADLRDLISQFPTAWPIYVVGQRILDDRGQYQSKRELQNKIKTDYLQKVQSIKEGLMKKRSQTDDQYKIRQNKLKIMRLVRALAKKTEQMN